MSAFKKSYLVYFTNISVIADGVQKFMFVTSLFLFSILESWIFFYYLSKLGLVVKYFFHCCLRSLPFHFFTVVQTNRAGFSNPKFMDKFVENEVKFYFHLSSNHYFECRSIRGAEHFAFRFHFFLPSFSVFLLDMFSKTISCQQFSSSYLFLLNKFFNAFSLPYCFDFLI